MLHFDPKLHYNRQRGYRGSSRLDIRRRDRFIQNTVFLIVTNSHSVLVLHARRPRHGAYADHTLQRHVHVCFKSTLQCVGERDL